MPEDINKNISEDLGKALIKQLNLKSEQTKNIINNTKLRLENNK